MADCKEMTNERKRKRILTEDVEQEPVEGEKKRGFFGRLKAGLVKTREKLASGIDNLVMGKAEVGPEFIDELEEVLLTADVGLSTTTRILDELNSAVGEERIRDKEGVVEKLRESMIAILDERRKPMASNDDGPLVVLMIGVNGSGKTTTIGKLARKWKAQGKKVMLAAGDTFRAAAIEQLEAWAERVDVPCIRQNSGSDPAAVAFDAVQAAVARQMDIVIVDTAGRLQTNSNLMEELKKVKRVIGKALQGAPHETLLVLDAAIGQNSISQAKQFHAALGIDGLVMTKLDGTAKGGVLLNIVNEMKLPVRYIGVGESVDDLQEFEPRAFIEALFSR